jgi:hypothetical protein
VEDGNPNFVNSVARNVARLGDSVNGLQRRRNGDRLTLYSTHYDLVTTSGRPEIYLHGKRLPSSSKS